jgi:amino acid transporter
MIGLVIYNMLGFSLPGNMAGSVQNPKRNFPLAMFIAIVLIIANYFLPVLLVAAAPLPALQGTPRWSEWQLGYFSLAAQQVCTPTLRPFTVISDPSLAPHRLQAAGWQPGSASAVCSPRSAL